MAARYSLACFTVEDVMHYAVHAGCFAQVDDTGEPGAAVMAGRVLAHGERALLRAGFGVVRPLLRRPQVELDTPDADDAAVWYAVLRAALAARDGK